ncbi:MAG: hypothetical protein CMJ32_07190 [Phycisphaerae bacterium]|nr:hypothetical protein [Phycisphaerae bacterium]
MSDERRSNAWLVKVLLLVSLLVLIGVPLLVRPSITRIPDDARSVIIYTPHNEQIRHEFAAGFNRWHKEHHGEPAMVIWNTPGGTSEIRNVLRSSMKAKLEIADVDPDGVPLVQSDADLVFGGGAYEFGEFKKQVSVEVDGVPRQSSITAPVRFEQDWLDRIYGENAIGDRPLYDTQGYWFGVALSGFGIVYNRDVLGRLGLEDPTQWVDLTDPRLQGGVALVNPAQSGSITTAFQAILDRQGWTQGWRILRRAAANARYFSASSSKVPVDVSLGEAALGICIDFYGRYEAQAMREADLESGTRQPDALDRIGYIDPPGETLIDSDPIAMLTGAPNQVMARRFIEYVLTPEAQSLWQFPVGEQVDDQYGPERFELRRLPIRKMMYSDFGDRFIDTVDPFGTASIVENPNSAFRSFIEPIFVAMAMEHHHLLSQAWACIVNHPSYPTGVKMVTAADVDEPQLKLMLELFDDLPEVPAPGEESMDLDDEEALGTLKAGWLRGGWSDSELWSADAEPSAVLRRFLAKRFSDNYRRIIELSGQSRIARTR